jgi:pimeloyl-ACP methyl ester carboxylesterase
MRISRLNDPMPTIHLTDGSALYFADKKSGTSPYPALVLVHGAGGSHLDWPPALRRLPNVRVIAPDLPGHGRAPGPGRQDTLAYARDICALLDALAIRRAIIAGHSMGGAIAQQIALDMPDRAAGLILIGTGSKLPVEPTLPQRLLDEPDHALDWLIEWSWGERAPQAMKTRGRQRLSETPPQVLRGDYLACQAFDTRDRLAEIAAPTLVLAAEEDRMVKLKFSVTLAERIPHATLIVFKDAGHMFPLEKATEVAGAIMQWLAERTW